MIIEGDTIEQAMCRLRTEDEDRAVDMCMVYRTLVDVGDRDIQLYPSNDLFGLD
jgi:hypothetical protein